MNKQLIYVTEDDDAIRDLVTYALTAEDYSVKAFTCAEELLAQCAKTIPDLVLLDIMLPGMDGITALKKFRDDYKSADTRIVMLTAKASEINKVTGLDAGADDYITKPFSVLELCARVRAALRKKAISPLGGQLSVNAVVLHQDSRTVTVRGAEISLTLKEFELLNFLMLNAGVVVEREKLLKEVWGYEYFGETRTVDIHIKNLREKLGGEADAIQSVRGVGYIFVRKQP
ncbi:MAG: response regulator transcription factor [Firmicutes bacterium]|nr:response regulator transcription factor [Bacillota bacterium]